jgi:RHS repeat-associated protein
MKSQPPFFLLIVITGIVLILVVAIGFSGKTIKDVFREGKNIAGEATSNQGLPAQSAMTQTTTTYVYGSKLIASKGSTITYHLQDNIGSSRLTTDNTGKIQSKATVYPYGKTVNVESFAGAQEKYLFTGKERDGGLDYFGARYYTPRKGNFIALDPEGSELYAYVQRNPLTRIDPDGRKTVTGDIPSFPFRIITSPKYDAAGLLLKNALETLPDSLFNTARRDTANIVIGVIPERIRTSDTAVGLYSADTLWVNGDILASRNGKQHLSYSFMGVFIHEIGHFLSDNGRQPWRAIVQNAVESGKVRTREELMTYGLQTINTYYDDKIKEERDEYMLTERFYTLRYQDNQFSEKDYREYVRENQESMQKQIKGMEERRERDISYFTEANEE